MKYLLMLSRPQIWLYLLAALLPFERIPAFLVFNIHLRPSLIAAVLLVVTSVLARPKLLKPSNLTILLAYCFLITCLISSLISHHPGHALRVTIYTILSVLLALSVASTIKTVNLSKLTYILVGSTVTVVLFSFYQFIGDLAGLSNTLTGLKPMYSSQIFGFPRVQAASLEPLYFANYLLLPLGIVTAIGLTFKTKFILLLLIDIAIFLTLSRGGVGVAALVTMVFISISLRRKNILNAVKILGASISALIIVYFALTYLIPILKPHLQVKSAVSVYTDQVTNYNDKNTVNVDRSQTRALAIKDFQTSPLLGNGPGNFGYYAANNSSHYSPTQIVNNEPTELLAETGIIGFIVFVAFLISLFAQGIRALKADRHTITSAYLLGSIVYLGATVIQYWSFSTLYIIQVWFAIGLIIGLSQSMCVPFRGNQDILK